MQQGINSTTGCKAVLYKIHFKSMSITKYKMFKLYFKYFSQLPLIRSTNYKIHLAEVIKIQNSLHLIALMAKRSEITVLLQHNLTQYKMSELVAPSSFNPATD